MGGENFYEYRKGDYLVIITFDKPKHVMKIYRYGQLIRAPIEYPYQFWTRTKIKGELRNVFVEAGLWDTKVADKELEDFCLRCYEALERLRDIEKSLASEIQPKDFSAGEKERVFKLLLHPKLVAVVKTDMDRVIARETQTKLLTWFCYLSAFLTDKVHPRLTGESSTGKSYVLNGVAIYIPEEHIAVKATRITGRALEYHLQDQNLDGKIMIVQEFEGGQDAVITLRPLMSGDQLGGGLSLLTTEKSASGNIEKREVTCKGVPVLAFASVQFYLDDEFETRTWKMEVDESEEQTRAIARFHAETQVNPKLHISLIADDIRNSIRWLRDNGTNKVINPFASIIAELVPIKSVRIRRDLPKIFAFINISAWLHQLQRPWLTIGGERYIIPCLDDFLIAERLYRPSSQLVLVGTNKKLNRILDTVRDSKRDGVIKASVNEIAKRLGFAQGTAAKYLRDLQNKGFLYSEVDRQDRRRRLYFLPDEDTGKNAVFLQKSDILERFTPNYLRNELEKIEEYRTEHKGICIFQDVLNEKRTTPYISNEDFNIHDSIYIKDLTLDELHTYMSTFDVLYSSIFLEADQASPEELGTEKPDSLFSKPKMEDFEAYLKDLDSEGIPSFKLPDATKHFGAIKDEDIEYIMSMINQLKERGDIFEPISGKYFLT